MRTVVLIGNVAIKIPSFRNGWKFFLHGLLANIHERNVWRKKRGDIRLCPVICGSPSGLWLIMRRADEPPQNIPSQRFFDGLPNSDYQRPNLGMFKGNVVLIDYGNY